MDTSNIKMTRQRMVILDVLRACSIHPTADELYEMVRKEIPRISLATVYRNLETLSEAGLVRKLEFPGAPKRFDKTTSDHFHIRCVICGRVEDVHVVPSDDAINKCIDETGFDILDCFIDFTGICPDCAAEKIKKEH